MYHVLWRGKEGPISFHMLTSGPPLGTCKIGENHGGRFAYSCVPHQPLFSAPFIHTHLNEIPVEYLRRM